MDKAENKVHKIREEPGTKNKTLYASKWKEQLVHMLIFNIDECVSKPMVTKEF